MANAYIDCCLLFTLLNITSQCVGQVPDMEWQTPAVSEKFQSRFGRPPGPADHVDTAVGAVTSDPTEGDSSSPPPPPPRVSPYMRDVTGVQGVLPVGHALFTLTA